MVRHYSAALPVARASLRLLTLLNWLMGAGILALLAALFAAGQWTMTALGLDSSAATTSVVIGFRAIAALGLITVPRNAAVLSRLLAIIETVRGGDPFVAANAGRLQAIAWALLAIQALSLIIGAVADAISTPAHPIQLDAGFSVSGWLAVLLTFILARVFAEGSRMREDLEGTV